MVVAEKTKRIICTHHDKGKTHDFKLLKKSKLSINRKKVVKADSGYQGMEQLYAGTRLPVKGSKKRPLTARDKKANKKLAKQRVVIEHVIGKIKVFRIMAERYTNRRRKHNLIMKLICGIYNFELS